MLSFVTYNVDLNLQLRKTLKCPQCPVICPFNDFMNHTKLYKDFQQAVDHTLRITFHSCLEIMEECPVADI